MSATEQKDALKDQIGWLKFLSRREMLKCASFLTPLLAILVTSVWLQQPGFSRLFRVTQKALIGIHSGLQADSSIAPTLTITASRGAFILTLLCSRTGPHPDSTQVKVHRSARNPPFFPAVDFSLGISDIGSMHRLVPPTGTEGFVHQEFTLNVCSAEAVRGTFLKRTDFLIHCIDNLCLTQQRIKCTKGSCPRYSLN